jgi:predicted MFS family arabinose efflux permease
VATWLEARWGLPRLAALRATLLAGAAGSATSLILYQALRVPADPTAPGATAPAVAPLDSHLAREILPLIALLTVWMLGPALCVQFLNLFFSHVHKLSIERIGLVFAAASWGWALAVLASGELASRVGVRRVLFASLLAFAPAIWGLSLVANVGLAVALYCVQGLISPLTTPLIDQWLLGQAPRERQGAVSSWRQIAADVSAMLGASFGGRLLAASSFQALFLVAGAIAFVGAAGVIASARARSNA